MSTRMGDATATDSSRGTTEYDSFRDHLPDLSTIEAASSQHASVKGSGKSEPILRPEVRAL